MPLVREQIYASSLSSPREVGVLGACINSCPPLGEAESWDFFSPAHSVLSQGEELWHLPAQTPSPFSPRQLDCAKPIRPPRLTRLVQVSSLGSPGKVGILDTCINFFPPQGIAESSDFSSYSLPVEQGEGSIAFTSSSCHLYSPLCS